MATSDSGAPVPPYEGRQTEAHTETESTKDGARTAGATAPVSDDEMKAADPSDTPRGRAAAPGDEQPAQDTPDGESEAAATGPAHTSGTGKGEEQG